MRHRTCLVDFFGVDVSSAVMELNYVLVWMVALSSGMIAIRTFAAHRLRYPGWFVVLGLILGALVAAVLLAPEAAGYLSAALFAAFVLVPMIGAAQMGRLSGQQRYRAAQRWARLVSLLHPLDGWPREPKLLLALELAHRGDHERASALLRDAGEAETPEGRAARLRLLQMRGRPREVVEYVERHPHRARIESEPSVVAAMLRAFGELREVDAMLALYARQVGSGTLINTGLRGTSQLFVSAYAGRPDIAELCLTTRLRHFSKSLKLYWMATAFQAAGDHETAARLLDALTTPANRQSRGLAERRRREPLAPADPPNVAGKKLLERIETELRILSAVGTLARPPVGLARVTALLALAYLAVFAIELPGGPTDPMNLYDLGALFVPVPLAELEVFRLVAAGFLHYGAVHLVTNLVGLWLVGRYVERVLGPIRTATGYAVATVGSMTAVAVAALAFGSEPTFIVGASGGVMGLVGMALAIQWRTYRRERLGIARRELFLLLAIVALQTVFDLVTPAVSFLAHGGGAVLGLLLGLAMAPAAIEERLAVRPSAPLHRLFKRSTGP